MVLKEIDVYLVVPLLMVPETVSAIESRGWEAVGSGLDSVRFRGTFDSERDFEAEFRDLKASLGSRVRRMTEGSVSQIRKRR